MAFERAAVCELEPDWISSAEELLRLIAEVQNERRSRGRIPPRLETSRGRSPEGRSVLGRTPRYEMWRASSLHSAPVSCHPASSRWSLSSDDWICQVEGGSVRDGISDL